MITFTAAEQAQIDDMVARIERGDMSRDSFVRTTDMLAGRYKAHMTEERQRELMARQIVETRTRPAPTESTTAECAICYHVGPCTDDGEALICTDRAACQARCDAALDEPAAGAVYCAVCEGPAAPPAYNNGVPLCEACAIAQDEPAAEFYAQAQPPAPKPCPNCGGTDIDYSYSPPRCLFCDPVVDRDDLKKRFPPPSTPTCHCGAPATILVRERLTLHDLCDTCFQRNFQGNEERHTAWEVMEPPPHATMDEVVEWAYARRHVPLADEERYTHMHAPAPPEISDEEAIRIEALALLDAGADYCTVCGLSHRPTQCPEIGALLFRSAPAPLSPVEALRLAINKGVFGESTLAILRASLEAADEEALIKAEQLASAREHAGQTWETWQEERAAGAPF